MNVDEWKRVQALVDAVLRRDPGERDAFLDDACAGRPSLRAAVETLVAVHNSYGDLTAETEVVPTPNAQPAPPPEAAGRMIGPYIVRHEIGRGGMGVVYLADDTRLARRVALKALAPIPGRERDVRDRLRQEARAAAALSHPGIATVYALEEIDSELYLAYEYVPGKTLRALVSEGPFDLALLVDIALQLARALSSAHAQGIVHRDLKPENVVITTSGVVKVLDFGLARVDSLTPTRLTQTGMIVGTPAYMAPEQAQGEDVDFRTDLFAFGVMLYEMASGFNPFEARTPTATIARILQAEPPALTESSSSIPPNLDRILTICLRKRPSDRYKSTLELVADLERLQADLADRLQGLAARDTARATFVPGNLPLAPREANIWWQTHQVVLIIMYLAAAARSWQIKEWLKEPKSLAMFMVIGIGAMIGGTIRGHLLFTRAFNRAAVTAEQRRTRLGIVVVDLVIALALSAAGLMLSATKALAGLLTIALALGIALATGLMEPVTTAAAFGKDEKAEKSQTPLG